MGQLCEVGWVGARRGMLEWINVGWGRLVYGLETSDWGVWVQVVGCGLILFGSKWKKIFCVEGRAQRGNLFPAFFFFCILTDTDICRFEEIPKSLCVFVKFPSQNKLCPLFPSPALLPFHTRKRICLLFFVYFFTSHANTFFGTHSKTARLTRRNTY